MHQDARMYIEVRWDGDTSDLTICMFRDRGVLGTDVEVIDFTCDSHELTDNVWHEAYMNLMSACQAITQHRS